MKFVDFVISVAFLTSLLAIWGLVDGTIQVSAKNVVKECSYFHKIPDGGSK